MMHGLGNMHNGGHGMPAGVKMPRRRPAMWFNVEKLQGTNIGLPRSDFTWSFELWYIPTGMYMGFVSDAYATGRNEALILPDKYPMIIGGSPNKGYAYYGKKMPEKTWVYYIAGMRENTPFLWVNGEQLLPLTQFNTGNVTPAPGLYIGNIGHPDFNFWTRGVVRNIRAYNRPLLPEEILLSFGGAYPANGLVALYRGDGISLTNWRDWSGNGNHINNIIGSPERCLVHVRGAVIRTDPGTGERYIVE